MACCESYSYGPAHRAAYDVHAIGNLQCREQVDQLAVEEIAVVVQVWTVGIAPPKKVISKDTKAGGHKVTERWIPEIFGNRKSMDQDNGWSIRRSAKLVMRDAVWESDKPTEQGVAHVLIQGETFLVMRGVVDFQNDSRHCDRQYEVFGERPPARRDIPSGLSTHQMR